MCADQEGMEQAATAYLYLYLSVVLNEEQPSSGKEPTSTFGDWASLGAQW